MPAEPPPPAAPGPPPDPGLTLCLSGGGFRATLFHLGAVRRLNELGVLAAVKVVTSVSGGSILNGVLATRWAALRPGPGGALAGFDEHVAAPVRAFCGTDLRTPLLVGTRLNPGNWGALFRDAFSVSARFLADGYARLVPGTLADLPDPAAGRTRFVFCATNTSTGACWHFHGGKDARMGDFYAGYWPARDVRVADAVAASSAFPPGFSALRLRVPPPGPDHRLDPWGQVRPPSPKRGDQPHGHTSGRVLLTDGGVYDNLGVETVWDRSRALLVSDAARLFASAPGGSQWLVARLNRAVAIGLEQVAAVRRRWLVEQYVAGRRAGAVWVLHSRPEDFPVGSGPGYGPAVRQLLHRVRTDLDAFEPGEAGCLENHGYWLADAAVRSYARQLCGDPAAPFAWPDPARSTDAAAEAALADSGTRGLARDLWQYLWGR